MTAGAAFTEDPPAITGTGTVSNPVVFQRSGAGANPVLKPTGTAATSDFGIEILGGDYITFDGIDIIINSGSAVEWGYAVLSASATNGAQNNTIKNTSITLNRTNTSSLGILQSSSLFTPSSSAGTNNNNKYLNVTIQNVGNGIQLNGTASTSFPGLRQMRSG